MQKRFLAICMMVSMIFGTIGQNPFALANRTATARPAPEAGPDAEFPFEEEFAGDPEEGMPGGAMDPEAEKPGAEDKPEEGMNEAGAGEEQKPVEEEKPSEENQKPEEEQKPEEAKSLGTTITTSDGSTYEIEVTYPDNCGVPAEGTELLVSEILPDEADYDSYVAASMEQLGAEDERVLFARVFDITIADAKDHSIVYEPNGEVRVSIRLTGTNLDAYAKVDVLHITEQKTRGTKSGAKAAPARSYSVDKMKSSKGGDTVTFATNGFSVYVIVGHEGDDVETPRFTIHFLDPVTDTATQGAEVGGVYQYTTAPYSFVNTAGGYQTTQIIKAGEPGLELIANPPNQDSEGNQKFFYGWFVVEMVSDGGSEVTYRWTDAPKKLAFETPIGVTDNGDGTFTMTWTSEGKNYSETAAVDSEDYSAHIYVAPIYEDYCFVNFHEVAHAVSANGSLLTRKLVILGSDRTERVTVSDVVAPCTDAIRRIFRGWSYDAGGSWIYIQTVDNHNDIIPKSIDVTRTIDLYPYFQEGRWIYYNVGDSGNGATYVPAQFELTQFNEESGESSIGGTLTKLPVTSRVGYDFGGWLVLTGYENGDPEKPQYLQVTDGNGNFLSGVNYSYSEPYPDNSGVMQPAAEAYTIQNGTLTLKYPLSSLTFYAQWDEKPNSKYTVVIWKQKVTDAYGTTNKTYDFYSLIDTELSEEVASASGRTLEQLESELAPYRNLTSRNDFIGFKYAKTEMSDTTVRGDGSTVVNIYFDRYSYELKFFFARRRLQNGSETGNLEVSYLTGNFGRPASLTWQAYCESTNGKNWGGAGTDQLSDIYTGSAEIESADYNNYRYYYYVIRANYGANVSDAWPEYESFPVVNNYTLVSWYVMEGAENFTTPGQGDTVKGKVSVIDKQILGLVNSEDGNFLLASYRGTNNQKYDWTYNVYQEVLDGVDYSNTVTFDGRTFYLADTFLARSGKSDILNQPAPAYEGFQCLDRVSGGNLIANFYFSRNSRKFTFNYNYPHSTGLSKTVEFTSVPYGTSLELFNYKTNPNSTNAIWPAGDEIPDHYEFLGWFADASGTTPFDFSANMPDADKIIYGKWQPIYYNICIDPNGGVINHINYGETQDTKGNPLFYLDGLDDLTVTGTGWSEARDAVGNDFSWMGDMPAGTGHNTSQATYFSAVYGGTIGEYSLERKYVECDDNYVGTEYYYINMQFDKTNSTWGLHGDLRNALYLTDDQIYAYYMYCKAAIAWNIAVNGNYYDGEFPDSVDAFKNLYAKKDKKGNYVTYKPSTSANPFEFVGWYIVTGTGTISENPYNFTNQIEGPITLQGVWRRVGNYYLAYDTVYRLDENTVISGKITQWTDPENTLNGKYIDGATTTTVQQPTEIRMNQELVGNNIIFRGWQIVKVTGTDAGGVAIFEPLSDTYYDAAVPFIIDSSYADENECIHMQAIYQRVGESDRRPEVANLMLNANDGYLVDAYNPETQLNASDSDISITDMTGWNYSGDVVEDASEQEVVFGNMQTNAAVHLYKYAVTPGTLEGVYSNSRNFFKHPNNYLLIGFDEGSDYTLETTASTSDNLRTGEAYIPTFAADSVISVQRTDNVKLYAVWEPMVYVTFVNRTSQAVTFNISSTDNMTLRVVNEVTGIFSREKFTGTTVKLEPGEKIKFVMPKGDGKDFTVSGKNTSTAQLLTVTSVFDGNVNAQATAGLRSSNANFSLTDFLHSDPTGVLVYFDGLDTVFFDTNGGAWTDTRTEATYNAVSADASLVYVDEDGMPYQPVDLTNGNTATVIQPSDPTREADDIFVGWTTNREAALLNPAGYDLPGTDINSNINNLAVIKSNYLWDFSTEITEGMTLYAVWGKKVTVTFHITDSHTWNQANDDTYYVPGANLTYTVTLAKGEIVNMPIAPTYKNQTRYQFYRWIDGDNTYQNVTTAIGSISNIYPVGTPVIQNVDLYTSWTEAKHIDVVVEKTVLNDDGSPLSTEQQNKEFTFTAVITTVSFTLTARYYNGWNQEVTPDTPKEETQTITLKNGESCTIPLYFVELASTSEIYRYGNNPRATDTVYYQSITITEISDPNYTIRLNGVEVNNGYVTTMAEEPRNSRDTNHESGWDYTTRQNSNSYRTYTLYSRPEYTVVGTTIPKETLAFTNTRTKTDVTVTKIVNPDDYLTGDETFRFTATYADNAGGSVTPAAADGYTVDGNEATATFTLKNGESVVLRGVPIDGSVAITEFAPGFTAESIVGTITGSETSRMSDVAADGNTWFTFTDAPADGSGTITYTNTRDTYDVKVTNTVLPDPYGSTTKAFVYTATLWNGDTQVVFPSTIQASQYISLTNGRKDMQISLKDGENYIIENLPGGYKLVVTQTADSDYVTESRKDSNDFAEVPTRMIDALSADAQIDFKNTLKTGFFTINKSVHLEQGQVLPPDTEFDFTAKLLRSANDTTPVAISQTIADAVTTWANANNVTVNIANDVIAFKLKDRDSIVLSELPVGYFLQVQESASGYAAYVNNNRQDSVTMQIAEGDNGDINFTNKKTQVILKIGKVDAQDGTPIQGTKFTLSKLVGGVPEAMYTLTSDVDGWLTATVSGNQIQELDLENGTYYLTETETVSGYKQFPDTITIVINSKEANEADWVKISGSSLATITVRADETEPFILTVMNERVAPAPTDYRDSKLPFMVLLLAGFVLLGGFFIVRKKKED